MKEKMSLLVILMNVLLLSITASLSYGNPLPVPFKPQVPPGQWAATNNCGQTATLMVMSYWKGSEPTEQDIKDIDDWLFVKYGDPINNYNGSATNTTKLLAVAKEYGKFTNSYTDSGWTLNDLKESINRGYPIIAAITASYLSNRGYNYAGGHFVVVIGYTASHIICNDPGTNSGEQKYYSNDEFAQAFSSQGGAVVVVLPTETVPEMSTDYFPIGDPNWAPNWYIAEGRLFFSDPNGEAGTVQFLFADLTPETKYLPTALSGPFSVSVSASAEGGDKRYVYGLQVFCVDPNTGKIDSEHSPRIAITPGVYRIDKNNGLGEVIVDWTMSPLVTGKNDLLKIERDNNTLIFYINNEQVASSNFGGCTNVFLGLFSSSNVKASFDDFTVVTPVIQTGHPSNPLPALPLDNTGVVNPAANTIAVLPGEITIQPSMSIPEGDQGQQAQLLMYIYLPGYNTGIPLFNGPTVTLGNIISFDSFFSGPIDCSTCSGLTADIYYGYSLPGGDIKYNAYELKISQ